MRALVKADSGEVGFEDGVKLGLGGVCRARTVTDVAEEDLGSCLSVVVRAKGRRSTKAMMVDVCGVGSEGKKSRKRTELAGGLKLSGESRDRLEHSRSKGEPLGLRYGRTSVLSELIRSKSI